MSYEVKLQTKILRKTLEYRNLKMYIQTQSADDRVVPKVILVVNKYKHI